MYILVTAATGEVISTDDAKEHLMETSNDKDDEIDQIVIDSVTQWEDDTNRILLQQDWELVLDEFPEHNEHFKAHIIIKKGPVEIGSIVIQYYDEDETLQTLSSDNYIVDYKSEPCRIYLEESPATQTRPGAVIISFTAGYENVSDIPPVYIRAVKLLLGHYFENRQSVITGTQVNKIPDTYDELVTKYRII